MRDSIENVVAALKGPAQPQVAMNMQGWHKSNNIEDRRGEGRHSRGLHPPPAAPFIPKVNPSNPLFRELGGHSLIPPMTS